MISRSERWASALLGLGFAGLLVRFLWLNTFVQVPAEHGAYAEEAVLQLIGSPAWIFTGAMHLLVAVALAVLASRSAPATSAHSDLAYTVAVAGSVCFLVLSMCHIHGVGEVESAHRWCAADGHAALVSYNVLRVVALGGGMLALGAFLVLRSGASLRAEYTPAGLPLVGFVTGLLCVLHALMPTPSVLITGITVIAVVVWSASQVLVSHKKGPENGQ